MNTPQLTTTLHGCVPMTRWRRALLVAIATFIGFVRAQSAEALSVERCVSIAHVIAAIALELSRVGKPPEIHFGWSNESPMAASVGFLLFGEGNVPWMVRELIRRAEPDEARRPLISVAGKA